MWKLSPKTFENRLKNCEPSNKTNVPINLNYNNLKKKKVDYILVAKPWPIELRWMQRYQDKFKLVFSDRDCKIFKYEGEGV